MQYQVTGKIIEVGDVIPCTGKVREKCTFLIRDEDDDGREIAFLIFDDNIDKFLGPVEIGDKVRINFSIKTRKYTDHHGSTSYITSCFALNIERIEEGKKSRSGRDKYRQREDQKDSGPFGDNWRNTWGGFGGGSKSYSAPPPPPPKEGSQYTDWFTGCKDAQEAKKRYRVLSKQHHPDMPGGSKEKFQEINNQYERWK